MKSRMATVMAMFALAAITMTANAQTGLRIGGPLAVFYRGQTVSTLAPAGGYINPALSGTTSTYRTIASGQLTSTYSTAQYTGRQVGNAGPQQSSQQTNNGLTARYDSSGALTVQWTGDTSNVKRVYIGIVDADYNVIEQKVLTSLPVRATFKLTSDASQYGVKIEYANGSSSSLYAPIP